MRLWSLHPNLLDRQGLVACWRETLLAQAVLLGKTAGYRNHPQLLRFRACPSPAKTIGQYLTGLADEARQRGYRFDSSKIVHPGSPSDLIAVTAGQIEYERQHLLTKIQHRNPDDHERIDTLTQPGPDTHPLFTVVPGEIEHWERL